MAEGTSVEVKLGEEQHAELLREADRLGLPAEEVTRRALAAWLIEMHDDSVYPKEA